MAASWGMARFLCRREMWQETRTRSVALQHVVTDEVDGRRLALFATFLWKGEPRVAEPEKAFEHKKVTEMHGESPARCQVWHFARPPWWRTWRTCRRSARRTWRQ